WITERDRRGTRSLRDPDLADLVDGALQLHVVAATDDTGERRTKRCNRQGGRVAGERRCGQRDSQGRGVIDVEVVTQAVECGATGHVEFRMSSNWVREVHLDVGRQPRRWRADRRLEDSRQANRLHAT